MQGRLIFVAGLCAVGSACATSTAATPLVVHPGNTTAKPSMEALPSSDVEEGALTREMRMARMLSAESLTLVDPAPPLSRTAADIEHWSAHTLGPWLEAKHTRAEAARRELDLAAAQNERQRIMSGALVGLVYEDVARVLLGVPAPAELDNEPEVLAMYRDVLAHQAQPYLFHAKLAYDACAANAQGIKTMQHWSAFCGGRSGQLPSDKATDAAGKGETTVSVSRE